MIHSRPLKPWVCKNAAGAVSLLRLALPSQRSRCVYRRRGALCARQTFPSGRCTVHTLGRMRGQVSRSFCGAAPCGLRRSCPHATETQKAKRSFAQSFFAYFLCQESKQDERNRPPLLLGLLNIKMGSGESVKDILHSLHSAFCIKIRPRSAP